MLVRRIARPMLAASFVAGGIEALRNPAPHVKAAAPLVHKGEEALPDDVTDNIPTDPATLVRINAGAQIGGGLLLATGKLPRLASLVLAGTLVPSTWAGHAFWEESDSDAKAAKRTHFIKNVSLLGGLLITAVDTEGKPSVAWRTRHGAERVAHALPGGDSGSNTGENLKSAAHTAAGRSQDLAHRVAESDTTKKLAAGGSALAVTAAHRAQDLAHTVATSDTTKKLAERSQELAQKGAKRGAELASDLSDEGGKRGRKLAEQARKNADGWASDAADRAKDVAATAQVRGQELTARGQVRAHGLVDTGTRRGRKLAKNLQKETEKQTHKAQKAAKKTARS